MITYWRVGLSIKGKEVPNNKTWQPVNNSFFQITEEDICQIQIEDSKIEFYSHTVSSLVEMKWI